MIGQRLAHFEVLEKLGEGGMGTVYRALDTKLHRNVALKVLPPAARNEVSRQRLLEEARAASGLNHPAIVTLYEVGSHEELDFIAMEVVEGETIAEALQRGPFPESETLAVARSLASALAVAHRAGIVHRDLKPSNVMLTEHGPKILDFGLAKRKPVGDSAASDELPTVEYVVKTEAGVVTGTPAYMAPEQARGQRTDGRSDLFSLGGLLFEMLTGRRCFAGNNPVEVLSSILRDTPPPPTSIRPELHAEWNTVVARLLEKDPARRFQTPSDLQKALGALDRSTDPRPSPARVPLVLSLAAIAAVVAVGWWLWPRSDASPSGENSFPQFRFRLLLDYPGSEREPSLSPEGNQVVFVADDANGVAQLWLTDLDGRTPSQLSRFEDGRARDPSWLPDGSSILVAHGGGIWELPLDDGEPLYLLDGFAPTASPDGRTLAFNKDRQVWLSDRNGGDPRPLTGFQRSHFGYFAKPAFSPDGQRIAFFWPSPDRPLGDLWTVGVDGSGAKKLTDLEFLSWGSRPAWTEDGEWVIFTADHDGSTTLWRASTRGNEVHAITEGAGSDYSPSISDDLTTILYANGRNFAQILLYDPETGAETVIHRRRDLAINPEISPDGKSVAFFSRGLGGFHLYRCDLATGDVEAVSPNEESVDTHPTWSRDGRMLYYYQQKPTSSFRRVDLETGEDVVVIDDWLWSERMNTQVSPDGEHVVYELRDRGRTTETRVRELETGREQRLDQVLHEPRWTADGRSLYGASRGSQEIQRCDLGSSCAVLTEGWSARLTQDEEQLFVLRGSPPTIWRRDLATGEEESLHTVHDYDNIDFGWGVLPDQRIMHHSQERNDLELWIGSAEDSGSARP